MKKYLLYLIITLSVLFLYACDSPLQKAVVDELKLPAPTIFPDGTIYATDQEIMITSPEPDAKIRYSVKKSGTIIEEGYYSAPFTISGDGEKFIVEAYLQRDLALDSDSVSETYELRYDMLPVPTISLVDETLESDDTYDHSITVQIEGQDGYNGEIYYQIPQRSDFLSDSSYKLYTGPITLNEDDKTFTVNAYVHSNSRPDSSVISEKFILNYPLIPIPELTPAPGSYNSAQSVTISQPAATRIRVKKDVSGAVNRTGSWQNYSSALPVNDQDSTTLLTIELSAPDFKTVTYYMNYNLTSSACSSPQAAFVNIDDAGGELSSPDLDTYVNLTTQDSEGDWSGYIHRHFSVELTASGLPSSGAIFYTYTSDGTEPPIPNIDKDSDSVTAINLPGLPTTYMYTEGSPIPFSSQGNIRICAVAASPALGNSIPRYVDVDLSYLTLATSSISYTGGNPTNSASISVSNTLNASNPAQQVGINRSFSIDNSPWSTTNTTTLTNIEGTDKTVNVSCRTTTSDSQLIDSNGTSEDDSLDIRMDMEAPILSITGTYPLDKGARITYSCSGEDTLTCTGSGSMNSNGSNFFIFNGCTNQTNGSWTIHAEDTAGNITEVSTSAVAGVLLVDDDATGEGDGNTWTDAYTSIQSAINDANAVNIPEIWVASGSYKSTSTSVISLTNCSGLRITGGFKGLSHSYSDKGSIGSYPTILDGEDTRRCIISNSLNDNVVLKNLVISNGFSENGGGALLFGTHTEFDEVIFKHNNATSGGAVYVNSATGRKNRNKFRNCVFAENHATNGAGVYQRTNDFEDSPSTEANYFFNCSFFNNKTTVGGSSHGGAFYLVQGNIYVYNSLFYCNTTTGGARGGGGWTAYVADYGYFTLINCGTMVDITTGTTGSANDGTLTSCTINDGTANTDAYAGMEIVNTANYSDTATEGNEIVLNSFFGDCDIMLTDCLGWSSDWGNPGLLDIYILYPASTNELYNNGSNTYSTVSGSSIDLYSTPRIQDGIVDIGAIEN